MKKRIVDILNTIALALFVSLGLLSIIGTGGGDDTPPAHTPPPPGSTYSVSVTVTGLAAGNSVVLQNNLGDDLTITEGINDGVLTPFATPLADESDYAVTVLTQPTTPNQTCSVTNATGTIAGADVVDVAVTCVTNQYSVSVTVNGLAAGNEVVLQNNLGDDLTIPDTANGVLTPFATPVDDGADYAVTVLTQPTAPNQTCSVTNESGTIAGADIIDVAVDCVTNQYTVSVTVNGLAAGNEVVLQNNGGDDLTIPDTANGVLTPFATALDDGSAYAVTVLTQPTTPDQACFVANGSGTLAGADVTDVVVTCAGTLDSTFGTGGMVVSNNAVTGGTNTDQGWGIALDGTDILVTGSSNGPTNEDMVIWRYDNTGVLVPGFGTGGIVASAGAAGGTDWDRGNDILVDGANNVVVTGWSMNATPNEDMVIWRYDNTGTPDAAFGTGGIAVNDNAAGGNGSDVGYGILRYTLNNYLVITGYSVNGALNQDMVIWLYDTDAAIVPGFGTGGVAVHDSAAGGSGNDIGMAIAEDGAGNLLVAGYSENGDGDLNMTLWRYLNTGVLDATFGGDVNPADATPDGFVVDASTTVGGVTTPTAGGFAITQDGTDILVCGNTINGNGDEDMTIWRYDDTGTLDATFGTGGIVTHDNAAGGVAGNDRCTAIVVDGSHNVLAAGFSRNGTNGDDDMVVWRYTSAGLLDTTFGGDLNADGTPDGFIVYRNVVGGGNDWGRDIVLDADGNILVTGSSNNGSDSDMAIWRYTP
jgi:uncharacterized delta-60 repeat protein